MFLASPVQVPGLVIQMLLVQHDPVKLEGWAKSLVMAFNTFKCHMTHISSSSRPKSHFYELCGTVLSSVTSEKYIGVYLRHNLDCLT